MIVSQFTLSAITNKGNKPSFHKAASTEKANYLYDLLIERLNECPIRCQSGVFGSDMDIHSVVAWWPKTIWWYIFSIYGLR